jgi:hypothetical protein
MFGFSCLSESTIIKFYTQNKLVCEKCLTNCIDFEYNEDIIFLKENYRRYKHTPKQINQNKLFSWNLCLKRCTILQKHQEL